MRLRRAELVYELLLERGMPIRLAISGSQILRPQCCKALGLAGATNPQQSHCRWTLRVQ